MSGEIFTLYYKPDGSKDKFGEIIYLIHINEHEMAVTTNPKAAKVYELAGVSDAKEFAERQRVILQEEAPE